VVAAAAAAAAAAAVTVAATAATAVIAVIAVIDDDRPLCTTKSERLLNVQTSSSIFSFRLPFIFAE